MEFSDEEIPSKTQEDFDEAFIAAAEKTYEAKEQEVTTPIMRELERVIMLRVVDEYWMDHIDAMDDLKQGVRLQGYGNNNPVDVYKRESLEMFEEMVSAIQDETVRRLYSVRLRKDDRSQAGAVAKATVENVGGDGTTPKKAAREKGREDRPQRSLPLRQRAEVEEVYLQGVSPGSVRFRASRAALRR